MIDAIRPLMIALLALPVAAFGAGEAEPTDPVAAAAQQAVARRDYAGAAELLRAGLAKAPGNADYHSLYAHALLKGPHPDMDLVFRHYHEALRLDPRHRGAYEYLGEAYLSVGNVQKAREQLTQLDRLCLFGCEEYAELKKAVQEYEAKLKR